MERWSTDKANAWWNNCTWSMGFNYVPSDAVNDIEMWMNGTFNIGLIGHELALAGQYGYNALRVFLSYAVWKAEKETFLQNFELFLQTADKNGMKVMPVLFDDCAFDFGTEPVYGPQLPPCPGVHNSRWVPSPGFALQDSGAEQPLLAEYVKSVIGRHRADERVLIWDLYNEPGNTDRTDKCLPLLKNAFEWARAERPVQPLTAGIWRFSGNEAANEFQLRNSDVISLHAYTPLEKTKSLIAAAAAEGRPVMVTEWLHRPNHNGFEDHLPFFRENKIGIWQWGLIRGKTQTNLSWATMNGGVTDPDPVLWQHDLLYPDGRPYKPEETELIRRLAPARGK